MKAVQYDRFGGVEVLEVREVAVPRPGRGEVLVRVRAAGINPGESSLRTGALAEMFPSTFPSGQGSDLAGVITELGPEVGDWEPGDGVVGWVDTRSSHAEFAAVPAAHLVRKPEALDWTVAGSVFVAGATAWAAVRAVGVGAQDTLVVSGAAGGVGGLVVQLGVERGATVLGIAGESNHGWLKDHGVIPIDYADGHDAVAERIRSAAPGGVAAFVDTIGGGYVDLAVTLGVQPDRIDTIIDWAAAQQHGVRTAGNAEGANADDLGELVARLADGRLELPVAATFPLADVRAAYAELDRRHTRGKIVLLP